MSKQSLTLEQGRHSRQFVAPPLEVCGLNKRYKNNVWANRDITLNANPGEILGILGPNGAGKTTLVRQITTELLPTSGQVRVLGHDVVAKPDTVKALLGIVPQEAQLFDYLTVYHHLRIFGKLRGLLPRDAARRSDQLVADLRLGEHRNTEVRKLSGGLRRRLLIGIAALANPALMVLDEPTTGLDPQSRRDLWSLLKRYREQGATVLLTTHYMEEAEALCDRVGIIQNGRLLALDTIPNLRATYGYQFKITYSPNGAGEEAVTLYGSDAEELVDQARRKGIQRFAVAPTSLEDIYLGLTDQGVETDDRTF